MVTLETLVQASPDQVSCDLEGEAAILNLKTGVYYGLDPVGAVVWKLIEQPRTVASVRDAMLETYEVDAARCERNRSRRWRAPKRRILHCSRSTIGYRPA